jgi:ADP-ribose pyrophosphatase YjhB (NUDIX family)
VTEYRTRRYRIIARALIFQGDRVLLAQDLKHGHHFPPGGGVEFGESVTDALTREVQEELEWDVRPSHFVGCLEHSWQGKRNSFEINFYFVCEIVKGESAEPRSREDHLRSEWIEISKLPTLRIFPKDLLPELIAKAKPTPAGPAIWFSTLASGISSPKIPSR